MAPYLVHEADPPGFITYDDPQSTARKVIYALQVRDLGGVFMWELSADFDGKNQDLMKAMYKAFRSATGKAPDSVKNRATATSWIFNIDSTVPSGRTEFWTLSTQV